MAAFLDDEGKKKQIIVRANQDDRQALEDIRKKVGLTMADVVRNFAQNNRHRSRSELIGLIFGASTPSTTNRSHFDISLPAKEADELASISKQLGFNSADDLLLEMAKRALDAPSVITEQFVYGRIRDRASQEASKEIEASDTQSEKRKVA